MSFDFGDSNEKSMHMNPCEAIDRQTSVSLATDAYHINRDDTCSQVCIPHQFAFAARMRGVHFGDSCQHLGYSHEFEDGVNRGVHFFKFYR